MIALQDFKQTLSHLTGAVTVVTTCDVAGRTWGFTATSLCSLSLEPPLVLCCLSRAADCYQAFIDGRAFAINILSERQSDLSQRFATKGPAKYHGVQFEIGRYGQPVLPGALAVLECSLYGIYPGGDHSIIVGLVEHGYQQHTGSLTGPLLYYARTYGTFKGVPED
jgi:flavin reductase ActVB